MDLHLIRVVRNKVGVNDSLNVYADYIKRQAISLDYNVDEFDVEMSLNQGLSGFIKRGLIDPFCHAVSMKREDVVHYTFEGLALFIPFCKSRKVVTFHHVVYRDEGNPWKWYVLWKVSAMLAVRYADIILAVSQQTKDEIVKEFGTDPDRIRVLSSAPNSSLTLDADVRKEKVIGYVGTLCERKNFSSTLRVFAMFRGMKGFDDYRLRLCGNGPLKGRLISEAKELDILDYVDFVSNLSDEELREMYNQCSLIFNTSSHEGVGFITVEAQNCGTPVLYFDYADIPENVMDAAIPCCDEHDMACKAAELLSDPDLYGSVVEKGLIFAKEFNRWCARETLDLYRELLDPHFVPNRAE